MAKREVCGDGAKVTSKEMAVPRTSQHHMHNCEWCMAEKAPRSVLATKTLLIRLTGMADA